MEWDTDYCIQEDSKIGTSTYQIVSAMLSEEAIRNLRSAQNIIRLKSKYEGERLEAACRRAAFYGNYKDGSVKHILERELDKNDDLVFKTRGDQLSTAYARDIDELIGEEVINGNICAN